MSDVDRESALCIKRCVRTESEQKKNSNEVDYLQKLLRNIKRYINSVHNRS